MVDPNTGGPRTFNRNDGSTGASFEVSASAVRFLSPKGEGDGGPGEEMSVSGDGEEIPF